MATQHKKRSRITPEKTSKDQDAVVMLKAENERLKKEVAALRQKKVNTVKKRSFWFSVFAGISATIAIVAFGLFNLAYWTKTTVVNTDNFVAATAPIISNSDVQKVLQREISNKIFSQVDVQAELTKALPENLQFIAGPIAGQVESFTTAKIGEVIASPQALTAWTTVLTTIHQQLISYIQNPNNDGKITVDELYKAVGNQLNSSKVGFLFGKNLPSSVGSITVKEITWLPKARQALNVLEKLTRQLAIATIVFGALAIGLSRKRVSMLVGMIIFSLIFFASTLAALAVGAWQTGLHVKPINKDAAVGIYNIVTHSLVTQTQGFIALLVAILIVILVASSVGWIVWLRSGLRKSLDWISNTLPWSFTSPHWLTWVVTNTVVIGWTLTGVMFVSFALRIPPTVNGVVTALAGSFVSIFILEIIASIERSCGHRK